MFSWFGLWSASELSLRIKNESIAAAYLIFFFSWNDSHSVKYPYFALCLFQQQSVLLGWPEQKKPSWSLLAVERWAACKSNPDGQRKHTVQNIEYVFIDKSFQFMVCPVLLNNSKLSLEFNCVYSMSPQVSMDVLHQDFHEDDAYSRDCTAFKVCLIECYQSET